MKRAFMIFTLLLVTLLARADEGMWLPYLLGQQVYADMVKKGLKLSKEQLYSINKASLKDAIVIFGGGCTGELVSSQGLIFTNHHCGYSAIANASTMAHNYLKNGFYARSRQEEIPAEKLSVQFLVRVADVTKQVTDTLQSLEGEALQREQQRVFDNIVEAAVRGTGYEARVVPMFKGNQYLLFVYQRYKDIRLVAAPPESVGKFGGDTDNWEWPRHTGDFSVFRVYADKNGQPATYAADNIPLKPKYFLPVSVKGVKENDYAMIFGYPGGTNRYETSYGVQLKTTVENPAIVSLRDLRLKYMFEQMKKDPATRLKLAASYAGIANYWKFYDGETKQLLKYHVQEDKAAQEAAFMEWAHGKPAYEHLFTDYAAAYKEWAPYTKHRIYIREGILGSPLTAFAASLQALEKSLMQPGISPDVLAKSLQAADKARSDFLENEDKRSDQQIMAAVCHKFYTDIPTAQHPVGFYDAVKAKFGNLDDDNTYRLWAAAIVNSTLLL
ncbi:MAG TPA: S46 family peptidase, partial [Chitinophaga sp.]|uniref:S46 family peptidase n=1 Tax=Chitinophaga sp. TaxID=1869181 RepID=UPI002DBDCC67